VDKTKANASPYTLTYKRTITVTSAGQTGTTVFLGSSSDILTFTVTVVDPCVAATIAAPSLTSQTVVNGATKTLVFAEATDSVDAAQPVKGYCGERDYVIVDGGTDGASPVTWISVAKDVPSVD